MFIILLISLPSSITIKGFEIFNQNSPILKEIDTIVLYKNKLEKKQFDQIQIINSSISNEEDIANYLILNFGNTVYEDAESIIFSK